MKTTKNHEDRTHVYLKFGKIKQKIVAFLLSLAILNLSVSCSYYTVKNVPIEENIREQVKTFNKTKKYIVLHSNETSYNLNNMVINEDEQTISGDLLPINGFHIYDKPRDSKTVHKYKKDKSKPLDEIHFYLKNPIAFQKDNNNVSIPLTEIYKISVNDKNTGRAVANIVLTTLGVIVIVAIIVVATKSSCPFVYVKNGEEYAFIGELYPGTITANMQKDNYLPLPDISTLDNDYTLKITNQLKEIQYTDQLQLLMVNHDKEVQVLLDSKGQIQTFKKINSPIKAILDGGEDHIEPALKKDNEFYAFNTSKATQNSTRQVVFEFDKPIGDNDAKLYISAKNSIWLDYLYGKFNEQFGSYYNTFQKDQQKIHSDSIHKWLNSQNIPLSVYVKTKNEWQLVDRINTVGPLAMTDIVVPVNLDNVVGDKLQVKLETGFMFWEVDYVGIDFMKNIDLNMEYVSPSEATDQYGNNVKDLLTVADQNYFVQPEIGDEVIVHFPIKKSSENLKQSFFLKNRGYYNYVRDYIGMPDIENLKSFREDNAFTRFSEKSYFDFVNFDLKAFAYHE